VRLDSTVCVVMRGSHVAAGSKKREAPAVVGPGLSCAECHHDSGRSWWPARYRDLRAFGNSPESERTLVW